MRPILRDWIESFILCASFTISELFFLSGITATLIGASLGLNFNTILVSSFSSLSSVYASLRRASTPLSTPAEGSITYGITHSLDSESLIASLELDFSLDKTVADRE